MGNSSQSSCHSANLAWMGYYQQALAEWGIHQATVHPLSLSENATYLITLNTGEQRVLRLHRPGFRKEIWIRSELAWLKDLAKQPDVCTMRVFPTTRGDDLCIFTNPQGDVQYAVLFDFLEGVEPIQAGLEQTMSMVGTVAARLHRHAQGWKQPDWLTRIEWTPDRIFGTQSDYGDWRDTPELNVHDRAVLEQAESKMRKELDEYGINEHNYGLIHTDLRSSNLLIDNNEDIKVLDFDDCGTGWFLFDMACSFTFEEGKPELPKLIRAYLRGYWEAGGVLTRHDMAFLPCMIMARALQLVAWVEKRSETETSKTIRSTYVPSIVHIAKSYLQNTFLTQITTSEPVEKGE